MDERRTGNGTPRFIFPDGELEMAVALGDLTDRSVRVWGRLPAGTSEASLSVDGVEVARGEVRPDSQRDHVAAAVLEVDPPRPGASFTVTLAEKSLRARFAPAPTDRARLRFAFGSCHQPFGQADDDGRLQKHAGARIYPRIGRLFEEREAAFALWLGDQVYSDGIAELGVRERMAADPLVTDADLLATYRHLYRGYFNETGYRKLAEGVPAYLMWDDHDIFDGWGSLLDKKPFDDRLFRAADGAFREYQHLRNPGATLDAGGPHGYSFWHGDVGFHVADLRSERDYHAGRVLGDAGWSRLDGFLAEAAERGVPTIFVGLSVPMVHASPTLMRALQGLRASSGRDVRDRWSVAAFAAERSKLLERLFTWQTGGRHRQVIVLSGDVHVGAAFTLRPRHGRGRLAQWTSSALSTPDGLRHVVVNHLITAFVRLGEGELRVRRHGLATSNNVGLVEVEPADGGGHHCRLTIYEYDARSDQLRPGLLAMSSPD